MMLGVAVTLSAVVLLAALFRVQVANLLEHRPALLQGLSRAIEGVAGAVLLALAVYEIAR
jgi:ABC-type nickel/cobalt efflux system permease component RcnA